MSMPLVILSRFQLSGPAEMAELDKDAYLPFRLVRSRDLHWVEVLRRLGAFLASTSLSLKRLCYSAKPQL